MLYILIGTGILATVLFIIGLKLGKYEYRTWQYQWEDTVYLFAAIICIVTVFTTAVSIGNYYSDLRTIRESAKQLTALLNDHG